MKAAVTVHLHVIENLKNIHVNNWTGQLTSVYPSLPSQDDLKTWVTNITASISEHEEIAKWGQPQPTTSSTDEGTRRDGSKVDNRSERGGERSDRGDRIERAEKEKEKERDREKEKERDKEKERERGERSERSERAGKSDAKRSEKSSKKKWAWTGAGIEAHSMNSGWEVGP